MKSQFRELNLVYKKYGENVSLIKEEIDLAKKNPEKFINYTGGNDSCGFATHVGNGKTKKNKNKEEYRFFRQEDNFKIYTCEKNLFESRSSDELEKIFVSTCKTVNESIRKLTDKEYFKKVLVLLLADFKKIDNTSLEQLLNDLKKLNNEYLKQMFIAFSKYNHQQLLDSIFSVLQKVDYASLKTVFDDFEKIDTEFFKTSLINSLNKVKKEQVGATGIFNLIINDSSVNNENKLSQKIKVTTTSWGDSRSGFAYIKNGKCVKFDVNPYVHSMDNSQERERIKQENITNGRLLGRLRPTGGFGDFDCTHLFADPIASTKEISPAEADEYDEIYSLTYSDAFDDISVNLKDPTLPMVKTLNQCIEKGYKPSQMAEALVDLARNGNKQLGAEASNDNASMVVKTLLNKSAKIEDTLKNSDFVELVVGSDGHGGVSVSNFVADNTPYYLEITLQPKIAQEKIVEKKPQPNYSANLETKNSLKMLWDTFYNFFGLSKCPINEVKENAKKPIVTLNH